MPVDSTPPLEWHDKARAALAAEPPDIRAALDEAEAALPDPKAVALDASRSALDTDEPDPEEVHRALEAALSVRPIGAAQPVEYWRDTPIPDPVLSFTGGDGDSALLSTGEVALVASAGGLGKSTITVGLAAAASEDDGAAFGLRIASGPVVLASYEDAPARIARRLRWYAPAPEHDVAPPAWRNLHLLPRPRPLWHAGGEGGSCPGPDWRRYWRTVREAGATLAIVDPASVALADVDTSQTGPVRAFLDAVTTEAEEAGCGVLVVCHDTKAARNEARAGGNPGAGAVAGSAAWYDAARGVLYIRREHGGLTLECLKSNYGPTGWGVRLRLREATSTHGFIGPDPVPVAVFDRDGLAAWRADQRAEAKAKKTGGDDGRVL